MQLLLNHLSATVRSTGCNAIRAQIMRHRLSRLLFRAMAQTLGAGSISASGSIAPFVLHLLPVALTTCANHPLSLLVTGCLFGLAPDENALCTGPFAQTLLPQLMGFDPMRRKTVLIVLIDLIDTLLPINRSSVTSN